MNPEIKRTLLHPSDSPRAIRHRLATAVAKMAHAIDVGTYETSREELLALALICDSWQLPGEAARIRRWIGDGE
jgi:hypothetical protein